MKFQWYVFDAKNPSRVVGCNDIELIEKYIEDPRYTLLTAQHGVFFNGSRAQKNVLDLQEELDDADDDTVDDEDEDEEDEDEDDNGGEDEEDEEDEEDDSKPNVNKNDDPAAW